MPPRPKSGRLMQRRSGGLPPLPQERPARTGQAKRPTCHEPAQTKAGAAATCVPSRSSHCRRWLDFGAGASPRAPPPRHDLDGPHPPRSSPGGGHTAVGGAAGRPQPLPDSGSRVACPEPVGLCGASEPVAPPPAPGHRTSGQSSKRASISSTSGSPGASSSALSRHGLARLSWCTAMYAIPRYSCAFLWRGSAFMALL